MNKSTKGALAAAGAAILLIGGAGSLAYWSASDTIAGPGAITAGELALSAPVCDGWAFDGSETTPDKPYDPATDQIVPGDVLSQSCTSTITASGEHLRATFGTTGGVLSGDTALTDSLTTTVTATTGDPPTEISEITEANNGDTVATTITVEFDPAADNTTQNLGAALSALTVTLEQVHN